MTTEPKDLRGIEKRDSVSLRSRLGGWGFSVAVHALFLLCATWLVAEIKAPPVEPVFRWDVALVSKPAPKEVQPTATSKPAQAPKVVERPRRIVEPAARRITGVTPKLVARSVQVRTMQVAPPVKTIRSSESVVPREMARTRSQPVYQVAKQAAKQVAKRSAPAVVDRVTPAKTVTDNQPPRWSSSADARSTTSDLEPTRLVETAQPKVNERSGTAMTVAAVETSVATVEHRSALVSKTGGPVATTSVEPAVVAQTSVPVGEHPAANARYDRSAQSVPTVAEAQAAVSVPAQVPMTTETRAALAQVREIASVQSQILLSTKGQTQGVQVPITTNTNPALAQVRKIETIRTQAPVPTKTQTDTVPVPVRSIQKHLSTRPVEERLAVESRTTVTRGAPSLRPDFGWLAKEMYRRVAESKRYPFAARVSRMEGKVVLRAVIRNDGQLATVSVKRSSGYDILDQDAMELIRKVCPLPMEQGLGRPQVVMHIPITYSLR